MIKPAKTPLGVSLECQLPLHKQLTELCNDLLNTKQTRHKASLLYKMKWARAVILCGKLTSSSRTDPNLLHMVSAVPCCPARYRVLCHHKCSSCHCTLHIMHYTDTQCLDGIVLAVMPEVLFRSRSRPHPAA